MKSNYKKKYRIDQHIFLDLHAYNCRRSRREGKGYPNTHFVVHGIQSVAGNNVPCVNESVERARRLGQVGVVAVIGTDAI